MSYIREQTPVLILFKKDTEKLREFDNINRDHYLAASVNFKIGEMNYSVQRLNFKFVTISNFDEGCSLSKTQKLDLDFDDLLIWFNNLDKTNIVYEGFQEPRYLYSYNESLWGVTFNKQY
jgi:hypothetical protein